MKIHSSISRMERLDVLRGIAVAGVVLVHSSFVYVSGGGSPDKDNSAVNAILTIFSAGRFGVEVFFLLSGFLIASIYGGANFSLRKFAIARFFRIWPLWAIFSILWFLLLALEAPEGVGDGLLRALFLSLGFLLWTSPDFFDSFIGGAWSIQIEVIAYGLFAIIHKFRFEALVGIAIAVNLLGAFAFMSELDAPGAFSSIRRLSFQTGFNFFLLGWLIANASRSFSSIQEALGWLREFQRPLLIFLWIVSFLFTPAIYGNPIEAFGFVTLSLVAAFVVQGRLKLLLEWLGIHSYFIFFAHFVALWVIDRLIPANLFATASGFDAVIVIFLSWLALLVSLSPLAKLSMKFIERPLIGFGKSLMFRRT